MYTIRSYKQSKHIRIIVRADGTVLVTKPHYVTKRQAHEFVQSKSGWIEKELQNRARTTTEPSVYTREHFELHKHEALQLFKRKVEAWNSHYGFTYGRITVRSMSSRWGSCSSKGNLSFNYRLMFLSERVLDYVVVHELCHLREFNHSKRFWNLVAQTIPDYKKVKKELSCVM